MNSRTARIINHATAKSAPAVRNALKREWLATPRNERSKLRGRIHHAVKVAESHVPTVEECMEARSGT
ncbi:MAG: hypothetical protein MUF54_14760 [Polyangiaceae bacterium]|jgi:hypothetical protein|nr:hypothetical protein [Polyangiaceae bacterium]